VAEDPELRREKTILILELEKIDTRRVKGKVSVTIKKRARDYEYGDYLKLKGKIRRPLEKKNPGGFNYRDYLARKGIYGTVFLADDEEIKVLAQGKGNIIIQKGILPLKDFIHKVFDQTLDGNPKALLKGIILGEREDFPPQVLMAFSNTGVVHILAVSGFNVGLVAFIFFLFFRAFRLPHHWAVIATLVILLLYAWVTDLTPSVVRATIMASILMIGTLIERETGLLNPLAFAAFIILIFWPQALFEIGFQLSFAATWGIIWLTPEFQSFIPRPRRSIYRFFHQWLFLPLSVSLTAQLATAPIVAHYFYRLPLISVLANLFIIPLVGIATALGFSSVLAGIISLELAKIFAEANMVFLDLLLWSVNFFNRLPFASLRVAPPSNIFLILYFLLLGLLGRIRTSVFSRKVFLFFFLLSLNLLVWSKVWEKKERLLEVTFLDVGQGDSIFLQFSQGKTALIDGGDKILSYDMGERVVAPFLWSKGIKKIDFLILSHPQEDHLGGLCYIVENFKVGEVIDSGLAYPSLAYRSFLETVQKRKIRYHLARAGETISNCGDIYFKILHPNEEFALSTKIDPNFEVNNNSIVLKIVYGKVSFLFPGDCETFCDEPLLSQNVKVTILKVPHHGSSTANSPDFVRAVHPEVAIISVVENNRFGFPSPEVLARYEEIGAKIYRTDLMGAITVKSDGSRYWIETMRRK